VLARVTGESAITACRTLMGPTNPLEAPPGTIRGDFATVITENIVHGSDSPESAGRELKLFFGE
jgi:nucleoside-diphosphate kinase